MADDSDTSAPDTSGDVPDGAGSSAPPPESVVPSPIAEEEVALIVAEEQEAARRLSSIEAGRRKAGVAGAAMAGAMLAIRDIVDGPKNDEIVAISETPDEPDDIDTDGITVSLEGQDFWAPPPRLGADAGEFDAGDLGDEAGGRGGR